MQLSGMIVSSRTTAALFCLLLATAAAHAQPQRYELGRRLRAFEEQWERTPGEDARQRCVAPLQQAVVAFFTARFGDAGRALDQARFGLDDQVKVTPGQRWAAALALFPARRLQDVEQREIAWEFKPFYEVPRPTEGAFTLRVALVVNGRELVEQTLPINTLPLAGKLEVREIPEGDHLLRYEVRLDKEKLAHGTMRISFITRLTERIAELKKLAPEGKSELATERATVQATVRLIEKLTEGNTDETDYPVARLLREAEAVSISLTAGKRFYTREHASEHWLSLVVRPDPKAADRIFPLRVLAPANWNENNPPPLIVALHGAGGSENLFFDGYGNGKIVGLCQERGWMLVTPRVGFRLPLAAILDELHGRYPFDRRKVFLIGHSMGAAAAVQAISLEPKRYAGIVALGGSGTFQASEDLKKVPFYISVGVQDFALGGARSLKERLVKAGVEKVTLRELADVEHLGIVQQALGEAFQFLDARVKPR